jgi:hypothetical protein
LSLALEPEAASMFCKLLPVDRLKHNNSTSTEAFKPGTSYIVLDLGGKLLRHIFVIYVMLRIHILMSKIRRKGKDK